MQMQHARGKDNVLRLAVLSMLSLGGIAVLTSAQTQERDPSKQEPTKSVSTTVNLQNTQSVSKAVSDLRRAIVSELEKSPSLQGKSLDSTKLIVTACDDNNVIAGAPLSTTGLSAVGSTVGSPSGSTPTDPTRPPDPNKPAAGRDDGQFLGALMLVGTFSPRTGSHAAHASEGSVRTTDSSRPTESGARAGGVDGGARQDLNGGTYMVRRAAASTQAVEIVDSNQRVVATVPIGGAGHDFPTRDLGAVRDTTGADKSKDLGDPTANPRDASQREASASMGGMAGMNATSDWNKIYMSIVHHFQPKFG